MSQVLLINPRKRGRKTAKRRKAPSAAQRANWARFAAAARAKSHGRRASNPIKYGKRRRVGSKRRRNPVCAPPQRAPPQPHSLGRRWPDEFPQLHHADQGRRRHGRRCGGC